MSKTSQIAFDREAFNHAMRKDLLLIKVQIACAVISGLCLAILLFT